MSLRLRPWTVKQGKPFCKSVHRKLPNVQGAMWCISVRDLGGVVGVALVGHPAQEWMRDDETLCVLRVAVIEGHRNACSMLYGACSRMAKASGAENLVTYTHLTEPGTSLIAAGWIKDTEPTKGGEHSRNSRPRKKAVDSGPKWRWWAPWSKRAPARLVATS